jgi:hypothetical protein
MDWVKLKAGSLRPPIIPYIRTNLDLANFDRGSNKAAPVKPKAPHCDHPNIGNWDAEF